MVRLSNKNLQIKVINKKNQKLFNIIINHTYKTINQHKMLKIKKVIENLQKVIGNLKNHPLENNHTIYLWEVIQVKWI